MLTNTEKVIIIDKVIRGFQKQRAFAFVTPKELLLHDSKVGMPGCRYRTPKGNKCAIGMLIPNKDYKPDFEGSRVCDLIRASKISINEQDANFYENLQHIHDKEYHNGSNWHRMMKNLRTFRDSFK